MTWNVRTAGVVWGAVLVFSTGCGHIAQSVAGRLADQRLKEVEHRIEVLHADADRFRQCVEQSGGTCAGAPPTPTGTPVVTRVPDALRASANERLRDHDPMGHAIRAAHQVMDHPAQERLNQLYDRVRQAEPDDKEPVKLSSKELQDYADKALAATRQGGWDAMQRHARRELKRLRRADAAPQAMAAVERHAHTAETIRRYVEAYFENGHFVQVRVDVSDLEDSAKRHLAERYPTLCGPDAVQRAAEEDPCAELLEDLKRRLLSGVAQDADGDYVFGQIPATGFVNRVGDNLAFPGIVLDVDLARPRDASFETLDYTKAGTEIVRVILEAVFDAHQRLPAVSTATGTQLEVDPLPVFDPSSGAVSQEDFGRVTEVFHRTDAVTGALVGRAIRGISVFSLDNEPLAELFTTAVSVTVAKAAEKVSWCWYSCGLDADLRAAEEELDATARDAVRGALRRVEVRLAP